MSSSPSTTPPTRPTEPAVQARRFFVRFAIVATAATFLAMVAMLYYSWWKRPVGTMALIVVVGDERHAGMVVRVEGATQPAQVRTLDAANNYICRIPVTPGNYSIKLEREGKVLDERTLFHIREHDLAQMDLRKTEEQK